jgi:hypothetical protein
MGAADAFRLAAAEVLNGLLPGKFDVTDKAELLFYVSGTPTKTETEEQGVHMQIHQYVSLPISLHGSSKLISGSFVFAVTGGTVAGGTIYKVQYFKERAYSMVSEFLKILDLN